MPKASFLVDENETAAAAEQPAPVRMDVGTHQSTIYLPAHDIDLDPVTDLRNGSEDVESLKEFAARLDAEGLAQPILVRPSGKGDGRYRVIAGRRRLLATRLNNGRITAYVRDVDDETARKLAFEENYRRRQFSPIDLARMFAEARGIEPAANWSERVSKRFGVSRATVTEHVKMYEGLAGDVELVGKVHRGEISADAAMLLAKEKGEARTAQLAAAKRLAEEEAREKAKRGSGKAVGAQEDGKGREEGGKGVAGRESGKAAPSSGPKVRAKHVRQAARASGAAAVRERQLNRAELVDGLLGLVDHGYPATMNAFVTYVTTDWQRGEGDQAGLVNRWRAVACLIDDNLPKCKQAGTQALMRPEPVTPPLAKSQPQAQAQPKKQTKTKAKAKATPKPAKKAKKAKAKKK